MKLDSQFCEQDNKLNVYIDNNRGEELLLLLKSKRAGLNKMNIAGAIQKDQRNQTKLGKEKSSRNNTNKDFQKNSVAKLHSLNNDQSQMGKQCSSLPSSSSSVRTVSKNLSVVKSASEKGKSDNVLEAQTRVGSLSSSPKWSRIKDKFERGDSSTCLEHKESSMVVCSSSNVSIKKNTLQKKPPESKIMPLQSRSVNVPSSKLKCSSLPYKLVSGNDRVHERTKRPLAFRTHTKYNSLENNSPKSSSSSSSSVQPTQSVLSRLNKPTVNLSEEVTKQKVKIPIRSAECKKNEIPNYQARKGILQDAKASTKAGNCHPVPTSRTSLTKPKSLLIYSNVSLHSANIGKPLQYTCKNKLSKEGCTLNENEMLAKCETVEKTANSKLKLQKSTATLPEQKLRTVSDSEQATHLKILDCEVTESKVAYLTNKFNFLSCQNLEMKKSCSAVNVDEANKYILSKSFSASNVFSTALRKNESYCHKSSQKQTSLTSSDEILSECLPANDTSCACTVMGKCSCLGLFSKQIDQSGKKPEGNHTCKAGGEICTQPVSNKNIPNQDLITTESERLSLVQKAVLSYEENLGILSPEKQKKGCISKLKDSPVTINGSEFNDAVIERIENHSSTANIKYASTTEKTVNEKLKRTVSNKEDTRFYSNDRVIKSVKEASSEAKQENSKAPSNSHMLSKSSRSLTLDSIRYTSSFLHNLTSSKECITTNIKVKELQLGERQYVNQSEMKIPPSLKPNSSFLWTSSSSEYKKLGIVGSNHYYENHMVAGENIHGQCGDQTKLRKQSNCSVDFGNNGSCDSDDQGSWIDVSDAEVDNEKHSSSSVLISTLRRNKGKKDAQKRNSLRRSWAESLRATACASDCNDDEYQDVSAWETVDGENSSGSTEMENHYEPLYESIYQNINFDNRSTSSQSPDDSNKHNSDTSSEIFDNDDDVASLNSEKTITSSMDEKKKSIKRQWSLNRSDIKTELTSKLNKMMSKKSSHSSSEIVPKTQEKNTETKKSTLMRYFRGQKSNTTGQLLGNSTAKKELSTFYINEKDIKSEDLLPCNKVLNSSVHNMNSMNVDEKIYPIHTVDHFRKSQSEKMIKPVLRRHVQRPTAPPPLPPGDPITKCRGGTKSMEFIHSQAVTFNKTRSLDSTYYNALSDGNVLYSEITIQECNLPNKNSVGEISSISTSEEMITSSSSSSERTISDNSTLSTCSKESRYSGNCYSVASSATDSSSIDRDRNSGLSFNRESRTNSGFCYMEENSMIGSSALDSDSIICGNKTEILKSPFEEEPLYQFYLKDVRTRATLWQRMISDDEQSETESVYVNVNEKSTDGPLVLKSQLSAMELIKGDEMGQRTLWCHVPEVKKSGILATLSSQDRNLQEAMFEVITSEASYLKSLNILVEHFIQCPEFADEFSPRCILNRRDRHVLFSDVLPVKEVSERLLADLEDHWKENIMLSRVCKILHSHAAKHFSVYIRYCSNQIYQDRTLKELKETKPEFTEVLNRLESSTACQCLDMLSFLMLPMQRITRLPLLVDAIFHRLSMESPLYESCKATLALLNKIVQDCNEGARKMERMEEMLSIERQLDFKDCKSIPLISTSRWLVKKGELTSFICDTSSKRTISFSSRWSKVPVYLFLFTDYLMITKKKSEENFAVLDYCPRNMVQVAVLENDDDHLPCKLPSSGKNFFQLTMLKNHKNKAIELVLAVSLESERTRWMDAVTPPISENPDERIYEVWDCPQVQCIYPYTAQQPDELMLDESDVVNVFRKMSDGWYEGERIRDGVRGWFPASYTEEIVSSHVRARNLRQRYRLLISLQKTKTCQGK